MGYAPAMAKPKKYHEPAVVRFEPGTLRLLDAVRGEEERAVMMRRWILERLEAELRRRSVPQPARSDAPAEWWSVVVQHRRVLWRQQL